MIKRLLKEYEIWRRFSGHFDNVGKFKIGDRVKYNFWARLVISRRKDERFTILRFYNDGEGIDTTCGDHMSAYWMKKA